MVSIGGVGDIRLLFDLLGSNQSVISDSEQGKRFGWKTNFKA